MRRKVAQHVEGRVEDRTVRDDEAPFPAETAAKGDVVYPALRAHIRRFFKGHRRYEYEYRREPAGRVPAEFRVVRVAPGPRTQLTTYLSLGAWEAAGECDCALEFLVTTQQPQMECVELLAMVAYYHRTEGLGVGHTFPLGHEWLDGSCDHMLVSLPYPFGPELEVCSIGAEWHIRFLWLLPITAAEKRFRHEHGLEALEQRFDEAGLQHAIPWRESVVFPGEKLDRDTPPRNRSKKLLDENTA